MQAITTALAALSLAATAMCQQEAPKPVSQDRPKVVQKPQQPAGKAAPFVFEAGEVELLELIDRCGAYLHYNILVDAQELSNTTSGRGGGARNVRRGARGNRPMPRGQKQPAPAAQEGPVGPTVTLQLPVVTDHDGCEELLSSMLWTHGLALVPLDEQKKVYEVINMVGQRSREIVASAVRRTPEQVLARPMLRQYVMVVAPLKHTNAQLANNALRPFYASYGGNQGIQNLQIGNIGNTACLILSGPQFIVANALKLLETADVPSLQSPHELETKVAELENSNKALLQRLESLEKQVAKQQKRGE